MSTKLYDGLRVVGDTDLFSIVNTVSSAITGVFEKECLKLIAKEMVRTADSKKLREGDEQGEGLLLFRAEDRWREEQNRIGDRHALNDPLRFSMVFAKISDGRVLAYPYHRTPEYTEALMGTGIFEDYHYQNSADQPDEISESDWGKRRSDWDEAMDAEGTFGSLPMWALEDSKTQNPFSLLVLSDAERIWGGEVDINSFRNPEQRLREFLINALSARLIAENKKIRGEEGYDPNLFRFMFNAERTWSRVLRELPEYYRIPRPEAIPGFGVKVKDLPPLYEVSEETLEWMVQKHKERIESA